MLHRRNKGSFFYLLDGGNRLSPRKIAILEKFGTTGSSKNTFNLLTNNHQHFRVLIHYFVDFRRTFATLICAVCLRDMISEFLLLIHYSYSEFFYIKHCFCWLKCFVLIFLALFLSAEHMRMLLDLLLRVCPFRHPTAPSLFSKAFGFQLLYDYL
jgi:hypothetical protein